MAAMSRGKDKKASKVTKPKKGGTASSRRHHFESFSQRIAKLNIDPVRRTRRAPDESDLSASTSYLKTSFEEWLDLNLSENFRQFSRQLEPLIESLPQILHYDDRIMDLLITYIEKGDALSLEPLLNLTSRFAHDLGARFEKHFARTVKTICQVAAKHPDIEVIEWSFTCLAWLFKYLSRLLVPDLRPLYDLVAPMLGKEHQKHFITRFAAEAMSFLLRKAGASYYRDKEPLVTIMAHALKDLEETAERGDAEQYELGLMSLFIESIKGLQRGLHSSGQAVFKVLLAQALVSGETDSLVPHERPAMNVVQGVLTAIIHHTDSENFKPILDVVLEQVDGPGAQMDKKKLEDAARLLFTVSGVRKGTRVEDWSSVMRGIAQVIYSAESNKVTSDVRSASDVLATLAVILQSCPMDVAIPHLKIVDTISSGPWQEAFLPFCNFFAEIGQQRFQSLIMPQFRKFIVTRWNQDSEKLAILLPRLAGQGCFSSSPLLCPQKWQEDILESFRGLSKDSPEGSQDQAAKCNAFLDIVRISTVDPKTESGIYAELYKLLNGSIKETAAQEILPWQQFAVGSGFRYVASHDGEAKNADKSLWIPLCRSSSTYMRYPVFWDALCRYARAHPSSIDVNGDHIEVLADALIECLGSPSHELRTSALDILKLVYDLKHNGEESDVLNTAVLIESIPLNIQTARNVSMHIRRLASSYKSVANDTWLSRAIPTYCFGLLYVNFTQVWGDSCNALKEICETKEGEQAVSQLAFAWLDGVPQTVVSSDDSMESSNEPSAGVAVNEFECSNLSQLTAEVERTSKTLEDAAQQIQHRFKEEHKQISFITSASRSQALRVLSVIPQVAEKRSRSLVPTLLRWAVGDEASNVEAPVPEDDSEDASASAEGASWSRKDQKAMLSLFSQFTNPKVLFRSADVYSALLALLANGDVEIQKSALKAVLTWKNRSINRYEENLMNLLDDARFREQVSVFLDIGQDDESMQVDDRTDVMPVVLRMLYGKVIARAGSASGRRGQESRRKAVFIALTKFGDDEIRQFIDIALGPLAGLSLVKDGNLQEKYLSKNLLDPRKQFGLLNMLEDMLDILGTQLSPFAGQLIDPVLYCLITASRTVSATSKGEEKTSSGVQLSILNSIRQVGFHCLNLLFNNCPEFEWSGYVPSILEELVNPKLEKLPVETAQSVSGILKLVSAWSKFPQTVSFLVQFNNSLLDKVAECLEITFAKEEVKLFILRSILQNVITIAEADPMDVDQPTTASPTWVQSNVLGPKAGAFLTRIGAELQRSPSKDLLEAGVQTVSRLAPFVVGSAEADSMINISIFLLQQPTRRVSPRTKGDLLNILHNFVPRHKLGPDDELTQQVFQVTSSLFGYFQDRRSRELTCNVLEDLANIDPELTEVASISHDLNAFSKTALDEPDFDLRSKAFHLINEDKYQSFSIKQWLPLVYNMLFYIKEKEELVLRINSSFTLRRFVEMAAKEGNADVESFQKLITTAIIPGIHNGVRENSELVRTEYLSVLARIVRHFPDWSVVSDMHVLLVDDDEEASFFGNVLHIQQHRRMRALRRLAGEASKLASGNIAHIFIPLLEHFIFDREEDDSGAANLAGETTRAIGALAQSLEWPQYRALVRRYSKGDMDKTTIRLLGVVIDSLDKAAQVKGIVSAPRSEGTTQTEDEEMADADGAQTAPTNEAPKLAKTLPSQDKLSADFTNNLLPPLMAYIHHKDDSTVSLRVPVAVIIVKLLRLLPADQFAERLPPVLLDVSAILRSRDQTARDMTRKTLADISALIGPEYFGFMLKALRTALQRGYQLHVLSFTVHSILVSMTPTFQPGELDYCLNEVVSVAMDDIFGVTGQEKDAEEYISKMKEVKSSKSFDSMELIAKSTTVTHFVDLINPVQALLLERLDIKMVKKIDELLRRIGLGVLHNEAIENGNRDVLVFCYQLIQAVYKANTSDRPKEEEDPRTKRYLINMKAANKMSNRGATTSHIHKLIRFSLDVLRTVLQKHDELRTPKNIAGFMPIIGDAVVSGQEEIQMSAIRLLSSIIKVPLEQLDKDAPVYAAEAVRILRNERDTNTELAQACLKLVSAVLRERRNANVKEKDVAYLLKRVKDDLEQPDRQGVTFNFLKAVLSRKIVITEVYDIMDTVAAVMVTNQTRTARDLSRNVYFQFIMEYPQSKDRLSKQIAFLVKNLDYKYKEGRQSVMEALHLLLNKVGDELVQDIADNVFAPLVLRLVNDDDKDCREMAGALLKKVFERADAERTKKFVSIMKTWFEQEEQTLKRRLAIQCWTLYFEQTEGKTKDVNYVLRQLPAIMEEARERQEEGDWELLYYSLQAFAKLCKLTPDKTFAAGAQPVWTIIRESLTFPHGWVKLSAARLIGLYFSDFASHNASEGYAKLPLVGSGGLGLTGEDMLDLTSASLRILRVPGVSEELATQAVRNLVFLGRCFAANELRWKAPNAVDESALKEAEEEEEEEEEEDEEAVDGADANNTAASGKTALQYLFERLSAILRREPATTRAPSLYPKTASMTLIAALSNALPLEALRPTLPTILLPLHNLTDATITTAASLDEAFNEAHKGLVGTAHEVMALLQKKLGTSEYVAVLQKVREGVKERRESRRVKRRLEAVREPERAERVKRRKHENTKARRKEKGHEARGQRRGW
ncbi:uncharacterized protein K452DRAFT_261793 [Aplosporella prunicola CBS 121167]|uniref:Uncharacterized protein n=1 Tax=Aplosporella prunicola CBS 121167 TaxID=1176127 RepID=A0A6A6BTD4_9PEZI|nr:uncharacterized protein K452DRAFT_261793 [Aplosporella prunicola CBS 121167]KAF2147346.1 hypothetical protein K452DRAFT_261793 [Aplosporella prunicola CBS 121167]